MGRNNLRKKYIEAHPDEDVSNKQAHHVIPVEILKKLYGCDEAELPKTFNEEWNCLMLPTDTSQEFVHRGSHSGYTAFIQWLIDDISHGNITDANRMNILQTVAAIIRTFCEVNMEQFIKMNLEGTIDNIEEYAKIAELLCENANNQNKQ